MTRTSIALLFATLVLLTGSHASAFIKVDNAVTKRFGFATTAFIGTVTAVDLEKKLIEATSTDTFKGPAAPPKFQMQVTLPADQKSDAFVKLSTLLQSVKVGQQVIIMAKNSAVIHIADGWYGGKLNPRPSVPTWVINQADNTGHRDFPGTTADLGLVLKELKGGKYSLLDYVETKPFQGGAKQIGKLPVADPTFLLSADFNGDGKPDLLVGTAQGVKLFLASGDGYTDATEKWKLGGVIASAASSGDVTGEGRISLLLDQTLYLNDGQKFTPQPAAIVIDGNAHVVTSALAPFTGGTLYDAALLLDDGRLLVFKNPGKAADAWSKAVDRKIPLPDTPPLAAAFGNFSPDGTPAVLVFQAGAVTRIPLIGEAPPADFQRLTGDPLNQMKGFASPLKNVSVTPLDLNGDGHDDLFVTSDNASMAMVYRGFGAFISDADMGADIKGLPSAISTFRVRAGLHSGGKGPDDMLLLGEDGTLFRVGNAAK